jgi:hypothetical protein
MNAQDLLALQILSSMICGQAILGYAAWSAPPQLW